MKLKFKELITRLADFIESRDMFSLSNIVKIGTVRSPLKSNKLYHFMTEFMSTVSSRSQQQSHRNLFRYYILPLFNSKLEY